MIKSRFIFANNYSYDPIFINLCCGVLDGRYQVQSCMYLIDPTDFDPDILLDLEEYTERFKNCIKVKKGKIHVNKKRLGFDPAVCDDYHIVLTPVNVHNEYDSTRETIAFKDANEFFRFISKTYKEAYLNGFIS